MEGETTWGPDGPPRRRFKRDRSGVIHSVTIGGVQGYITANRLGDGSFGEIFLHGFGQEGHTLTGMMDVFAIMVSIGLQYGAPFRLIARKMCHMRFEPSGDTDNPQIPHCWSIPDYIFKWLAQQTGDQELLAELAKIDAEMKP